MSQYILVAYKPSGSASLHGGGWEHFSSSQSVTWTDKREEIVKVFAECLCADLDGEYGDEKHEFWLFEDSQTMSVGPYIEEAMTHASVMYEQLKARRAEELATRKVREAAEAKAHKRRELERLKRELGEFDKTSEHQD